MVLPVKQLTPNWQAVLTNADGQGESCELSLSCHNKNLVNLQAFGQTCHHFGDLRPATSLRGALPQMRAAFARPALMKSMLPVDMQQQGACTVFSDHVQDIK